jgi:hypothetical protein
MKSTGKWQGPAWAVWAGLHRSIRVLVASCVALGWASGVSAGPATHATGPVPSWVEPVLPEDATPPSEQVSDGLQYLLIDTQTRVDRGERVGYRHIAIKALNERGVERAANIELRFDPSYQTLTLHAIQLRREGRLIQKLGSLKIEVLQREAGLESLIYDGTRTAHAFLDDVRVGDVVEYAYSLRGHNPVFGGRHFGGFDLQYGIPVERLHARLLWPSDRPLYWKLHNQAPGARVTELGAQRIFSWDLRQVPARTSDADAPSWFDPYPWAQWSEFADWKAVNDWALPLYGTAGTPAPRLRTVIDRMAAQHRDPAARLLAALQFVQSEVRYLGIEVGPGSHAPNPPELVLERRYGDCKDKTLLLIVLLRGLGIEAAPALVNTGLRHSIESHQASPGAFNHVLVRARVGAQAFWLDPTRAPQKGGLTELAQADFGRALVIDRGTVGLGPMAGEQALRLTREVRTKLDAREGIDKPVQFVVITTARGLAADNLRATLGAQSRDSLQKQYLNFYTSYFGEMEATGSFAVADDSSSNQLTVTERYVLKEFWRRPEGKRQIRGQIEVPDLSEYLRAPSRLVRQSPLSLTHPVDLTHITELQLPKDWQLDNDDTQVEDAAFSLVRKQRWDALTHTLTLTDHFLTLADHVPADRIGDYAANLEKARHESSLYVYRPDMTSGGDAPHWMPAVAAVLALLGSLWGARWLYRWNPPAPGSIGLTLPPAPMRIGGWLLLPAIGLPIALWRRVQELINLWPAFQTTHWLNASQAEGSIYHPLMAPLLLLDLAATIMLLVLTLVAALLFVQRRTSLPKVYIAHLLGLAAFTTLDILLLAFMDVDGMQPTAEDWGGTLHNIVIAAIWSAYFMRSDRVRRTFVWQRDVRPAPLPPNAPSSARA